MTLGRWWKVMVMMLGVDVLNPPIGAWRALSHLKALHTFSLTYTMVIGGLESAAK